LILFFNVILVEGNIVCAYNEDVWRNVGVAPLVYSSRQPHSKSTVKFTIGNFVKT